MGVFKNNYDEIRWPWKLLIFAAVMYFGVGGLVHYANTEYNRVCTQRFEQIRQLGYDNPRDVQVFCRRIDACLEQFIDSPGLQKQYELFRDGYSSDFIVEAHARKRMKEERNSGVAQGTATGVALGMVMGSK